jgi:ABC-type Na+ transport system ATPase subunit NatA
MPHEFALIPPARIAARLLLQSNSGPFPMTDAPYLQIHRLTKSHTEGRIRKRTVFKLQADFSIDQPAIVGLLGANGAGKTTLLELIAGNDTPSSGSIFCHGQNMHKVKYRQRSRIVKHHRQPNHTRRFRQPLTPSMFLEPARYDEPMIHLFDEPDMGDWYISLLFDKFRSLKEKGHLVFFCVHPLSVADLGLVRDVCDRYVFAQNGSFRQIPDFDVLLKDDQVREYLGPLASQIDTGCLPVR